jgi:hypothetical protein
MIKYIRIPLALLALSLIMASCQKDKDPKEKEGNVTLEFRHSFQGNAFKPDTSTVWTLENGEQLTFINFRYYFTNIALQDNNGNWWLDDDSYYIVDALNPNFNLKLPVPNGEYVTMRYTFGVDSVRNFSGAQEGYLSPSEAMFWTWNSGYIFIKSEGRCNQIAGTNKNFSHHVGGYQNPYNAVKVGQMDLPKTLNVDGGENAITLDIAVDRMYEGGPVKVSVVQIPRIHHAGDESAFVAQNFTSMFSVKDVRMKGRKK